MIDRGDLEWDMAQTMHDEPLDDLHPEDRAAALEVSHQMMGAVLDRLSNLDAETRNEIALELFASWFRGLVGQRYWSDAQEAEMVDRIIEAISDSERLLEVPKTGNDRVEGEAR